MTKQKIKINKITYNDRSAGYLIAIKDILKYTMISIMYVSTLLYIDDATYNPRWFYVILALLPCVFVPLYFYIKGNDKKLEKTLRGEK